MWNVLRNTLRFLSPIVKNKFTTFKLCAYFFAEGVFWVLFVFFVKEVIESFEDKNQELFYLILWEYGVYFFILLLLIVWTHNWWTYAYNRYRKTIESEYFPQYVRFDINTHEKVWTGKSIAIMSKGIKTWSGLIDRTLIECVNLVLSVGLTLYLLSQISIILGLFLVWLLFIGQAIGLYLNSYVILLRRKRIELDNIWSKSVVKIIMSKMEILQSQKIQQEVWKLHELHEWQIYYNKKIAPFMTPFFVLGIVIVIILLYAVFLYFWKMYFLWNMSLWLIASITGAILMMQKVFMNVLDFIKNFSKEFAEVQVLWDFFDSTPEMQWYDGWNIFEYKAGQISIEQVSYSYDDAKPVFQNFSLNISWKNITALVWPSGGGKSTLVKLISGYIRPDAWNIIVDGQKLSDTSLKSYYQHIWYLTQEPSVFDGTVKENLLYAVVGEPSDKEIQKIIKLAHCEFIYELPDGIDTEIGERGIKLSGWQKQRLAIAKIFLKNPQIIILDEPTSALDSLSEKKITEAMHNLFRDRTVLVIAHRLQTVKHASDIIVIDSGKIIERGTHSSLIHKNGYYKEMLDLQSGF